jgi:hypothetical protein
MLILGLFIITALLFVGTWLLYVRCHDTAAVVTAITGVVAGIIALSFVVKFVMVRLPINVTNKRAELETRYAILTKAMEQDASKSVVLAEDIAEYNAEVLQGRNKMRSIFSCTTYVFWDEIPLIEYGETADE